MLVRMLEDAPGSPDGVQVNQYAEGETYDVPSDLAYVFVAYGSAELVEPEPEPETEPEATAPAVEREHPDLVITEPEPEGEKPKRRIGRRSSAPSETK